MNKDCFFNEWNEICSYYHAPTAGICAANCTKRVNREEAFDLIKNIVDGNILYHVFNDATDSNDTVCIWKGEKQNE